jgi:thiol-disulfide isomerase/thioredoxin
MKKLFFSLLILSISAISFAQDTMSFMAKITNKNGDILYLKDDRNKIIQEMKIDDKGVFQATFSIAEGMYNLFDGAEYARLYLKNGYDLKMTMDAKQFDETIKFEGKGAKENNFIAQSALFEEKMSVDVEKMFAMDVEGFKRAIENKRKISTSRIDSVGFEPKFVEAYKRDVDGELMQMQMYYTQIQGNKKMDGKSAPNFDFENHKGGKTTLESLKGKYVYIDIWATWCGPCRAEIPSLQKVEDTFHGKNIEFVSISVDVDKDHDKWKTFVTDKKLGGIQLFADKNWQSDFITAFGINSIPRFILIDPQGVVVEADAKRPSNPQLTEQLKKLLN